MKKSMHISLRAGERIFLNGAVLRADRKVTLELMNDATFLLEGHVMQVEDTTTPLRQLYYVVQSMLMDPASTEAARALFFRQLAALVTAFADPGMILNLEDVGRMVGEGRAYEALKALRGLFSLEDRILGAVASLPPRAA